MAPPLIPNRVERRVFPAAREAFPAPESADPNPQPTPTAPLPSSKPKPGNGNLSENPAERVASATTTPSTRSTPTRAARTSTLTPTPTSTASSSNTNGLNMTGAQSGIVITIVVIIGIVIIAFLSYVVLKSLRLRYKDPKYLPGAWLKKKWTNWEVKGYHATEGGNTNQARINRVARSRANIEVNRALDRQNSVRSVITLPPYREMAEMDLERTIGREGERAGLDTIVAFPETADEEEDRREERMQAMYELRLQRRAQRAAREARERGRDGSVSSMNTGNDGSTPAAGGSSVSLTAMDMEAGGSGRTASELTAAILNDRTRRLSEVSYAEVGYARHDGSRVRATSNNRNNSSASDSQPLLSDNASGTGRRSRAGSMLSLNTNVSEQRGSMERRDSAELLTGADPVAATATAAATTTRLPPSYDGLDWGDAPPYMSPVSPVTRSDTASTRRSLARRSEQDQSAHPGLNVPLVRVIGASNPGSPMSPRDPNRRDGSL
ncbi:hypothetical protein ABW20_dc0103367 [Dactylellina cionopaga]|nr:hypothetical protein ABW20_dc0103367 [Dactylellina cionopaga]